MKTSELIKKLELLLDKHGDNEIRLTVNDFFGKYGEECNLNLEVGENTGMPSDYSGFAVNRDAKATTLKMYLNKKDGKKPKITFRY